MRRRRGFLIADALAGLLIVGIVMGAAAVALTGARKVAIRTADLRRAVELAERSALQLQTTGAIADPGVTTRVLSRDEAGVWTEITATVNGRTTRLVVLVPAAAGERGSP